MRKSTKAAGARKPVRRRAERRAAATTPVPAGLPSKDALLAFIKNHDSAIGKRDIARAFGLKGADRIELKRLLRELADEGLIAKGVGRSFREPRRDGLPPVALLEATAPDADGDLTAKPVDWRGTEKPPTIVVTLKASDPALGPGDRFLGRMTALTPDDSAYAYEARLLKKLPSKLRRVIGIYEASGPSGRIRSVDKRASDDLVVEPGDQNGARNGELVEVEALPGRKLGLRRARVIDRLGSALEPRAISRIAIHEQGLPTEFSEAALVEADKAQPFEHWSEKASAGREDLRDRPLVTIDPEDARDHDDAVHAAPDEDPANPGGWVVTVAIADVAAYVLPGSALDRDAQERGNSAYFPDRVVPMLPDRLSGDLCSLHEGVDRPCLAVELTLDADGALKGKRFLRGVMRSAASLTYEEAQAAWEGKPSPRAEPLMETVIEPLFKAYHAAEQARERRSPLDLELPERKVTLSPDGEVAAITFRDRLDAHRLIEEFMILANVAAAEALEAARTPLLYRVHDEPDPAKIESLRDILASVDIPLAKGQRISPKVLNRALEMARGGDHAELVNIAVLRSQSQAVYSPDNLGHYGLSLRSYAHFTSPIRRYADLVVHRALVAGLTLGGPGGEKAAEPGALVPIAEHISMTERRAMAAERDTVDRYLAAYLSERAGAVFEGRISGVQRFGLFIRLTESGADGFVPVASLGEDWFYHDEAQGRLVGERSGVEYRLGQIVSVRLVEATPASGGLLLELLEGGAESGGKGRRDARRRSGPPHRSSKRFNSTRSRPAKSRRR